jgi:DNA-binding MarR family transcriptional regulator
MPRRGEYSITDKGSRLARLLVDELRKVEREIIEGDSPIEEGDPRLIGLSKINAAITALWIARLHRPGIQGEEYGHSSIFSELRPKGEASTEAVEDAINELLEAGYIVRNTS